MTSTPRSTPVRLVLASALVALTLTACGSGSDGRAEGGDRASESASETPTGADATPGPGDPSSGATGDGAPSSGDGAVLVAGDAASTTTALILSASDAGGTVDPRPVPVEDASALAELLAPVGDDLAAQVRAAVRRVEVPPGQTLLAAVVAVGCVAPTGVALERTGERLEVTGVVPKTEVQCLVPVTSVALFLVESP